MSRTLWSQCFSPLPPKSFRICRVEITIVTSLPDRKNCRMCSTVLLSSNHDLRFGATSNSFF